MYISKYLAESGLCSRRNAATLVEDGKISVNGRILKELTYYVKPEDVVKYKNKIIKPLEYKYILMNKPKNYVTTLSDEKGRKIVLDLINIKGLGRIYPVGRLDYATTGLLLLTNDGQIAQQLSHPKNQITKTYYLVLNKIFLDNDFERLLKGVKLFDGFIRPDKLFFISGISHKYVGIKLHSGRNRIVRRMFEFLGYKVKKLDRVEYAGLTKKGLPVGKWRFLSKKELENLKKL